MFEKYKNLFLLAGIVIGVVFMVIVVVIITAIYDGDIYITNTKGKDGEQLRVHVDFDHNHVDEPDSSVPKVA